MRKRSINAVADEIVTNAQAKLAQEDESVVFHTTFGSTPEGGLTLEGTIKTEGGQELATFKSDRDGDVYIERIINQDYAQLLKEMFRYLTVEFIGRFDVSDLAGTTQDFLVTVDDPSLG